jgi:hypothetical protein
MCRALPGSEYYGGSAPPRTGQRSARPARAAAPDAQLLGRTGTVPVFTVIRSAKEEPDSVPAASPQLPRSTSPWSPGQPLNANQGVPRPQAGANRSRPISARFEPVQLLRDVNVGSSRTPFRHARRTQAIWQYRPAPALSGPLATLPGATRIRLPSASPPCCDRTAAKVSHLHSNQQHLTAQNVVQLWKPGTVQELSSQFDWQTLRCHAQDRERDLVKATAYLFAHKITQGCSQQCDGERSGKP